MNIYDDISPRLSELLRDDSFWITEFRYDDKAFGNFVVTLDSNLNFCIRIIRDRGDILYDIGARGKTQEWYSLEDALKAIGIPTPMRSGGDSILITLSKAVRENMMVLHDAFSPENISRTRTRIKDLAAERVKRLFNT